MAFVRLPRGCLMETRKITDRQPLFIYYDANHQCLTVHDTHSTHLLFIFRISHGVIKMFSLYHHSTTKIPVALAHIGADYIMQCDVQHGFHAVYIPFLCAADLHGHLRCLK